ncbi:multidrug effflux MFS transporter [Chelatococcus sp. SYSU_G07232]|uniref:Bcr/CflA family efflux transporter n=1 Tax=Chelatococcus albus TaxID=3047466 RepID=A0ABT7AHG9_9HYPH|nr:multidrug effflux MFS transporter [Chelatococcus sp. SYSU_G07232]MDJ1158817.1 multidrug effflux MFS transporter [Chelatococcus sp. SYSU_G07232]
MRLRPDTLAMTAVLALLTALGPLSTDMYLPSLPAIARDFGTTTAAVQATLSAFLFGFAAGQLVYGPLSDKFGRKPVLLGGLALFIAATAACAFAPNVEALILARFFQALGGSGPIVLARAVVRDLYEGPRAGRELSRMGTIMGLVPALAPVLGGFLQTWFGWRSVFLASLLFSLGLGATVVLTLPETLRARSQDPLSLLGVARGFAVLLQHRGYRLYVALSALTYTGLFAFISGSSFVLQGVYGLGEIAFGLSFASVVLGYIAGTVVAQRLVGRLGLDGTIGLGVACLCAGGLVMLGLVLVGTGSSFEITLPMALYTMGVGLTMPQAAAAAMMPFPERAGAASSLLGICQMTLAALVGLFVGHMLRGSAVPLPATIAALGVVAFLINRFGSRIGAAT